MGKIKAVLQEISDSAFENLELWIPGNLDVFFDSDFKNKLDIISSNINTFFDEHIEKINCEYDFTNEGFRIFAQANKEIISIMLADQLEHE